MVMKINAWKYICRCSRGDTDSNRLDVDCPIGCDFILIFGARVWARF